MAIRMKRNPCKIDGCTAPRWSGGLCLLHDRQSNPEKYKIKKGGNFNSINNKPQPKKANLIKPVSNKQKSKLALYRRRRELHFKRFPTCQFPDCNSKDKTLHHGRGRLGNFLTDMRWFKTLCPIHHRYVEDNPSEAKKLGLSWSRLDKFT